MLPHQKCLLCPLSDRRERTSISLLCVGSGLGRVANLLQLQGSILFIGHQVCYTETQRIEESCQFPIIGVSGLNLSFATTPSLKSRIFSDNVTIIRATQKHRQGPLIIKTSSSGSPGGTWTLQRRSEVKISTFLALFLHCTIVCSVLLGTMRCSVCDTPVRACLVDCS